MNPRGTLVSEQIIERGDAFCSYFSEAESVSENNKKKPQHITFSRSQFTNEALHHLIVFSSARSAKKAGPNKSPIFNIVLTRDNLCGVVNDTFHAHLSKGIENTRPSPYLAVVTKTATLVIRQPDHFELSIRNHDKWYKSFKEHLGFGHSWHVQLDPSSTITRESIPLKAFLCLNRETVTVVSADDYSCLVFYKTEECCFKTKTHPEHVLLTIKQTTAGSVTRCVIRTNSKVTKDFLREIGYYSTESTTPLLPAKAAWSLIDTVIELYLGETPRPNTLDLSHSCLTQLGIRLISQNAQPCWRDMAQLLGMSLDDVDLIIRWASSRYNVPRSKPVVMLPATYVIYHWQNVYNRMGVGDPPKVPRPCNKAELKDLLSVIGRNDLVQLLSEWEQSLTSI